MPLAITVAASLLSPLLAPVRAHAESEGVVCANAAERAQRLRAESKFKAAREELRTCSRPVCPGFVRKDCDTWIPEVEASLPSVVLTARTPDGRDVMQVKVFADGITFTDALDGRAVTIDPGIHVFRFEAPNTKPVEEKVVVKQGEKNRQIGVTLVPTGDSSPSRPRDTSPTKDEGTSDTTSSSDSGGGVPTLTWVFGGVSVVALGTALGFRVAANNSITNLRKPAPDGCAPNCTDSQVDPIRGQVTASNVAFGVGIAAAAAATFFFLTRPKSGPSVQAFGAPLPNGGAAGVVGSF
ncbi:MAG: hypothetical protein U0169_02680 [Polyangiaceae bacterium]